VTAPRHISTKHIPPKSKFTTFRRGAIDNNLSGFNFIAYGDNGTLVDTGATVTPFECLEFVNIVAHFAECVFTLVVVKCFTGIYENLIGGNACDSPGSLSGDECA